MYIWTYLQYVKNVSTLVIPEIPFFSSNFVILRYGIRTGTYINDVPVMSGRFEKGKIEQK